MTVAQAIDDATRALHASSSSPRVDAQALLMHVLARSSAWTIAHDDHELSLEEAAAFARACDRRRRGVPVAYIVGSAGFYGREFLVTPDVLVPRPETEHLVDEAIAGIRALAQRRSDAVCALDIGTGSGAIACTLALETAANVVGTDRSARAIAVAAENAKRLKAERCALLTGDLLEPVAGRRFDVVVANLPYVPAGDVPAPPDPVSFEPREALDGGPDGLDCYRPLLETLPHMLQADSVILLEAAPPTIVGLAGLVHERLPEFRLRVVPDYAGLARYVRAEGPAAV